LEILFKILFSVFKNNKKAEKVEVKYDKLKKTLQTNSALQAINAMEKRKLKKQSF
jgi:hypothetical protein